MPVIFIRYSPDKYKTKNKSYNPKKNIRYKILKKWLDFCLNIHEHKNFKFLNS